MIALGIAAATGAAFLISAVYYSAVPAAAESPPQRPMAALMLVELARSLAVAALVAGLLSAADRSGPGAGALLGLSLWILPVLLLAGSVFHEGVPMSRAAVHAIDWLIKLVAIGAIVGLFT